MLGFGALLLWPITGESPPAGVMTFAAGLIMFPELPREVKRRGATRRAQSEARNGGASNGNPAAIP